jgi:hypothetical protein
VITVREVTPGDFPSVHRSLLVDLNPRVPRETWGRLFSYPWKPEGMPLGYVMLDGDRPVGYLALVFAPVEEDSTAPPVCNVSSWVVKDAHRGSALRLMAPVLTRTDWTLLNLTPTPEVGAMFRGLGFLPLETHRCLLMIRPDRVFAPDRGVRVRQVSAPAPGTLSREHRDILERHGDLVRGLELSLGAESALLVYGLGKLRGLPLIRVHHVTSPDLLERALGSLQRTFLRAHGACMMVFDRRVAGARLPWGTRSRALPAPRLFRSPDAPPEGLGQLYNELILLDL